MDENIPITLNKALTTVLEAHVLRQLVLRQLEAQRLVNHFLRFGLQLAVLLQPHLIVV